MIRTGISLKNELSLPSPSFCFFHHHISSGFLPHPNYHISIDSTIVSPPPPHFYRFTNTTTFLSFYRLHYISIVLPPPLHFYRLPHHYISIALPPPLHFYRSTNTTTCLLFYHHHYISIVLIIIIIII